MKRIQARVSWGKIKSNLITIAFLILNIGLGYSQQGKIDSLKSLVRIHNDDTVAIYARGLLSKEYYKLANADSAILFANDAIRTSEQRNYLKGKVIPYLVLGNIASDKADYVNGLINYNKAREIAEELKDYPDMSGAYNNIGIVFYNQGNYSRAIDFYFEALQIAEKFNITEKMFFAYINIGIIYEDTRSYNDALKYYENALKLGRILGNLHHIALAYENLGNLNTKMSKYNVAILDEDSALYFANLGKRNQVISECYSDLGELYQSLRKYDSAVLYYKKSLTIDKQISSWKEVGQQYGNLGKVELDLKNPQTAKKYIDTAFQVSKRINDKQNLKNLYSYYITLDSALGNYNDVLPHYKLYNTYRDSLSNEDNIRKIESEKLHYDFEKQVQADKERQDIEKIEQTRKAARQRFVRNLFIGGFGVAFVFLWVFFFQRRRISIERDKSDKLLLNILPAETAEELKNTGESKARNYELVTVMFTDFKNFTGHAENMTPEELVSEINYCYKEFDRIIARHNVEKIKTMGDGYMAAGGVPRGSITNPQDTVASAMEIQNFMENMKTDREKQNKPYFEVRIGIHSGPVVAGIVGINKFAYDIWGDTVNVASRMESSGEAGKVNISGSTYELVKDKFNCTYRGKVLAKNKGEIDMYFVESEI